MINLVARIISQFPGDAFDGLLEGLFLKLRSLLLVVVNNLKIIKGMSLLI